MMREQDEAEAARARKRERDTHNESVAAAKALVKDRHHTFFLYRMQEWRERVVGALLNSTNDVAEDQKRKGEILAIDRVLTWARDWSKEAMIEDEAHG